MSQSRKAVRDYLKDIWEQNNEVHPVQTTLESVRRERDLILQVCGFKTLGMYKYQDMNSVVVEQPLWTKRAGGHHQCLLWPVATDPVS